jgi:hypothetical protein
MQKQKQSQPTQKQRRARGAGRPARARPVPLLPAPGTAERNAGEVRPPGGGRRRRRGQPAGAAAAKRCTGRAVAAMAAAARGPASMRFTEEWAGEDSVGGRDGRGAEGGERKGRSRSRDVGRDAKCAVRGHLFLVEDLDSHLDCSLLVHRHCQKAQELALLVGLTAFRNEIPQSLTKQTAD